MNGAHDLGGDHGHGPIAPDPNEPLFHAAWEKQAFGITLAMGSTGQWNSDQSRFARESMAPGRYLETTYYEHWLHGLEVLLADRGLVNEEEIKAGAPIGAVKPLPRILKAADVGASLKAGRSARRDEASAGPQKFQAGDWVRASIINPPTHTRLPRYVRGRRGQIERIHGVFVFPDTRAAKAGEPVEENPQWLYAVRFEGQELWGPDAEPGASVYVDLWDDYLDPA